MAFTVYTADVRDDAPLQFGDQDAFWYEAGGVLVVNSSTYGVRYYAPGQWQEVHYRDHPSHLRPAVQFPLV